MYMVSEECFVSPQINAAPQCGHAKVAGAIRQKAIMLLKGYILEVLLLYFLLLLELKRDNAVVKQNWIPHAWCHFSKR